MKLYLEVFYFYDAIWAVIITTQMNVLASVVPQTNGCDIIIIFQHMILAIFLHLNIIDALLLLLLEGNRTCNANLLDRR